MQVKDKDFKLFIDAATIAGKVKEIGVEISKKYKGQNPLFIAILNGSFIFASDLIRCLDFPAEISFIRISSYEQMNSTGKTKEVLGLQEKIEGRHVILLEDIVDKGHTINFVMEKLKDEKPASLGVATLLFKPEALEREITIDYTGFEIPDKFVVGYGLDYDGFGRNLKDLYQLSN